MAIDDCISRHCLIPERWSCIYDLNFVGMRNGIATVIRQHPGTGDRIDSLAFGLLDQLNKLDRWYGSAVVGPRKNGRLWDFSTLNNHIAGQLFIEGRQNSVNDRHPLDIGNQGLIATCIDDRHDKPTRKHEGPFAGFQSILFRNSDRNHRIWIAIILNLYQHRAESLHRNIRKAIRIFGHSRVARALKQSENRGHIVIDLDDLCLFVNIATVVRCAPAAVQGEATRQHLGNGDFSKKFNHRFGRIRAIVHRQKCRNLWDGICANEQ